MTRSMKRLSGEKLVAGEHEVGHVTNFYFDDEKWGIRYVVVDTGPWLNGRVVLISPHALGHPSPDGKSLAVNLTPQQIEGSPPLDSHKPVSRQYEEEYHRYYGWPDYWSGVELWGAGGFPMLQPPYLGPETQMVAGTTARSGDDDPHLRDTQTIIGYHIQTSEGPLGHVTDFMMDDENWAVSHLVVETGHWFAGKEIIIAPSHVTRISYDESKIFVNLTKEAIQQAPEYHIPPVSGTGHET